MSVSVYLSVRLTVCMPASQIILDQAAGDREQVTITQLPKKKLEKICNVVYMCFFSSPSPLYSVYSVSSYKMHVYSVFEHVQDTAF